MYKENGVILGFISIGIKDDIPRASLFAVSMAHEGKGISFASMRAVANRLSSNGFHYILVSTQGENRKALAVYKRFGCYR